MRLDVPNQIGLDPEQISANTSETFNMAASEDTEACNHV